MLKRCAKCRGRKDTSLFRRNRARPDGFDEYCKQCRMSIHRAWRKSDAGRLDNRRCVRRYQDNHRDKVNAYAREYRRRPHVRLRCRVTSAIYRCLKRNGGEKARQSVTAILGYTLHELVAHIERLFLPGMNWSNYGSWHIDHIKPICQFLFKTVDDQGFKDCWALTNLRPLWAKDNLRKSGRPGTMLSFVDPFTV